MLKRGAGAAQIYHLNSTPVPPVTFSLGHFSLQALERDSCTSKGAVQRGGEREREREREVRKMAVKKKRGGVGDAQENSGGV